MQAKILLSIADSICDCSSYMARKTSHNNTSCIKVSGTISAAYASIVWTQLFHILQALENSTDLSALFVEDTGHWLGATNH